MKKKINNSPTKRANVEMTVASHMLSSSTPSAVGRAQGPISHAENLTQLQPE